MVHIACIRQVYHIVTVKSVGKHRLIKRWVALLYTVMINERLNSVQTGSGH